MNAMWLCAALAGTARALDGHELLAAARARNGFGAWSDRRSVVTMTSRGEGGQRTREAIVSERVDPSGESRALLEFTGPTDSKGLRMLHVAPPGRPDEYWIVMPGSRRPRHVAGNAAGSEHRDEIFTGNDMSYRDLEMIARLFRWDAAAADATVEPGTCNGRPCQRVTLTPKGRNEFPFSRYVLSFDADNLLLLGLDAYGLDGRALEAIRCRDYVASGKFQTPRSCEIDNLPSGVRSVITIQEVAYDGGLDPALFTVASLTAGS